MEHDDMADERDSYRDSLERGEKDERKLPQDPLIDEQQPVPPFLNEGPELVRDGNC
jgi:hypothetical protein